MSIIPFQKGEQYEDALEWYDAICEINPDDTQGFAGKGDSSFRLKHSEEAIGAFARASPWVPRCGCTSNLLDFDHQAAC